MRKKIKFLIIGVVIILFVWVLLFFIQKNETPPTEFKVSLPFKTTISQKIVATGKVIPQDEIAIKPQVSGIIERILVKEGSYVKAGDLIAKIKVVPSEQSLNTSKGQLKNAKIQFKNAKWEYERVKKLFDKEIIAAKEFNDAKLNYNKAKNDLENAMDNLRIIKVGSAKNSSFANTNVRATVSGTILEIPIKKGHQVIESNNFNEGTTIAIIANLNKMIFQGKIDEADVDKLKEKAELDITIGAIESKKFKATLDFIAPKATDAHGVVMFKIKASMKLKKNDHIRAGYSANAEVILKTKSNILAIKESLVQYDGQKPFVEVQIKPQIFKRKNIVLGISNGIDVEVISGIQEKDAIKVWNKSL